MFKSPSLIGIFLIAILAKVNSECIFSGSYSEAATYAINYDPLYPTCREFHFGGFNVKKNILLAFANSKIDCRTSNIIVTNEFRQPIFNFCTDNLSSLRCDSSYFAILNLIINAPFGTIVTDINFSMTDPVVTVQPPPSTTTRAPTSTTQAPPSITTKITLTTSSTTTVAPAPPTTTSSSIGLKCGVPTYKPNDSEMRIVGGVEAVANSWPWQVFLTDGATMCGGTLINEQWILTAAHCISGNPTKAYLGAHDLSKTSSSSGISVSKIIGHPSYNTDTLKNDIALMKLEKPVTFNDKIQPACLPANNYAQPGRVAMVTGWGKVGDYAGTASTLRQVAVPIRSSTECSFFGLSSTQFCAGYNYAGTVRDSCQGDSGGPLVTKEGSNYVLAGVVSFGGQSCDGYGVYTNVRSYVDWIQKTISSN
ncbi:unnamed protein product [Brachionus calyciflorus]|uniref:Peptidase S1 domain-containing protein n=1 Tax=Brachionus calyciflorus TaxID=104777 RepID=A0A813S486_9BILA|nr:unnamed protein product [Brachionus calyciflorus]